MGKTPNFSFRGLRKGDPLSPYFFIICAEGLSALIKQAEASGEIRGTRICRAAPNLTNLLFADNSFCFFLPTPEESARVKNVLQAHERDSGQAINFQKSGIFFSKNLSATQCTTISNILGVSAPLNTGKYLGLPSLIGRSKREVFGLLRDKLQNRLQGWQGKLLSQAGRKILIKAVGQAIPTYCMSVFLPLLPSFWWGQMRVGESTR